MCYTNYSKEKEVINMTNNISCIKHYCGEVEKVCYLVYYRNGNTVVPVCCFTNKADAISYCDKYQMIQFNYTKIFEIPIDCLSYNKG